ncbi:uncharacterized protein RCO7_09604 [Rhynchosporium graminicola]|uniref:Uncharacterized protein n=1 Tax=Rhynchosporium graminicola TaxID=2792576 RepID=A0A1E1LBU4_9HELO|nr:uncharacterized protein RCO7_09604 [Rhynchosporium commune]
MKITIVYLSLATRVVLANALDNHVQLRAHQQDSDEDSGYDPMVEYLFRMCNPFYREYLDKPGPSKIHIWISRQSSNVFAAVTFGTPMLAATNAIGAIPQSHHDGDSDGSLTRLRLTLTDDKFPNNTNNTAVSNYWTTSSHAVATIGRLTGAATGRQTTRTATDYDIFTSLTSGTGNGTGAALTSTSSTAAVENFAVRSGLFLVVVNVVVVMLM